MPDKIIAEVTEVQGETPERRVRVAHGGNSFEFFYRFRGDVTLAAMTDQNFVAISLVFYAMRHGQDLHIKGHVSKKLLANLDEFQIAWSKWRKDYTPIHITADTEYDQKKSPDAAVLAYSGGVDANFSLLRHLSKQAGRRSKNISAAVLVHGFDIPLGAADIFAHSERTARDVLAAFKVPLAVVETDWKEKVAGDWEMEFGAGLAAVLFQFSALADTGLVGSDEDYNHLVLPWGSNPVTNPLLASESFSIQTDGAGQTRCEKVKLIAEYPPIAEHLRVCWMGPLQGIKGGNCGKCEKCLRTKMNFMANGKALSGSLSGPPSLWAIMRINVRNSVQMAYLQDILETARRNKIQDTWVKALKVCRIISKVKMFVAEKCRQLKRMAAW